jgi:hypothetical protein
MDGAGAAGGNAAAEFRAGELQVFAKHPEQRRFGSDGNVMPFPVHSNGDHWTSPWSWSVRLRSRRSDTLAFRIRGRGIIAQISA